LERRDVKGSASLLEKCYVNLMQPPDQKSRPLAERPGIAAFLPCFLGHP